MLGAIIGDIAGSVYEFDNIKTKNFVLFGDHNGEKCCFTDDTVMTVAVAEAILKNNGELASLSKYADRFLHEIGHRYPDSGYGERFGMWLFLDDSCPYNSFGNGAAMRISPAAYAARSFDEALLMSDEITGISHNHPEGYKGARATTACIYLALHGADKAQIKKAVTANYYPLVETLDQIRPTYRFNETCQNTVPQAIEAFLESESFEDAIRNAISLGGDSDTLAAITGSIAEAYYGIPQELKEQARSYLTDDLLQIIDAFEAKYQA